MKVRQCPAALVPTFILYWHGTARGYRPVNGTDAAVAEPGEVEIELRRAEYLREGSERIFAPSVRFAGGQVHRQLRGDRLDCFDIDEAEHPSRTTAWAGVSRFSCDCMDLPITLLIERILSSVGKQEAST
jgi:hypothetical protein